MSQFEPGSALAQDFADDKAAVISSAIRDAGFRRGLSLCVHP